MCRDEEMGANIVKKSVKRKGMELREGREDIRRDKKNERVR